MMERILAWTGDRAGDLGRPELQGAGQVSQQETGVSIRRLV